MRNNNQFFANNIRKPHLPEGSHHLFNFLSVIRDLEDSGVLLKNYTFGFKISYPNESEKNIFFDEGIQSQDDLNSSNFPLNQYLPDYDIQINEDIYFVQQPEEEKKEEKYLIDKYSKKDKSDSCCICIEEIANGNQIIRLKCLHFFHEHCIKT